MMGVVKWFFFLALGLVDGVESVKLMMMGRS